LRQGSCNEPHRACGGVVEVGGGGHDGQGAAETEGEGGAAESAVAGSSEEVGALGGRGDGGRQDTSYRFSEVVTRSTGEGLIVNIPIE